MSTNRNLKKSQKKTFFVEQAAQEAVDWYI